MRSFGRLIARADNPSPFHKQRSSDEASHSYGRQRLFCCRMSPPYATVSCAFSRSCSQAATSGDSRVTRADCPMLTALRIMGRNRIAVAVLALLVCGFVAWVVCCSKGPFSKTSSNSGRATPTPPPPPNNHSVAISWRPSASLGVATYNVYRSTASGGPYTRVGWRVDHPSFTDTAVQPGTTYFYVVTSVTTANVESTKSSEIRATVPTP